MSSFARVVAFLAGAAEVFDSGRQSLAVPVSSTILGVIAGVALMYLGLAEYGGIDREAKNAD